MKLFIALFSVLLAVHAAPNKFTALDPFNVLSNFEVFGKEREERGSKSEVKHLKSLKTQKN